MMRMDAALDAARDRAATDTGRCAACGAAGGRPLLRLDGVPTNSCVMLDTATAARAWPRGAIALMACEACGFVANRAADPALTEYSARYEPTQGWSPAFRHYHRGLAERLAASVPLHGRRVVEVGCGQGEFLHLLCCLSGATGLGFDPAVDAGRADVVETPAEAVRLVAGFFDAASARVTQADLLVCKMTLEHIAAPDGFAALAAQVARNSAPGMRLFVQVPDAARVLGGAFEDIYYEHVNYLTEPALRRLFARHGFAAEAVWRDYEGQYLGLLARHDPGAAAAQPAPAPTLLAALQDAHAGWAGRWQAVVQACGRVAIWGGGSKGVAFLHALGPVAALVGQAVDINPHRQGRFMPGSATPIVGPAALRQAAPGTVVVMNAVYQEEVRAMLRDLGLAPRLLAL
jgi:SAM-dependent methyltransferase